MVDLIARLALSAALLAPGAAAAESAYTHLDFDACTVVDAAPQDGPGAWAQLECDGLPSYPVLVADDDGRMSLDYGPAENPGRWESFAGFNRVHDTIEWRLGPDGAPYATIHRWFVSGGGQERQVLVVSTVASAQEPRSCVVGMVDTAGGGSPNRRARSIADEEAPDFRCGVDRARYFGPTGPRPPQFSPAPAEPAAAATPAALVRDYWSAAEAAAGPDDLARFRLDGAPGDALFAHLTRLAARYRVASIQPLVASDAERRIAVVLRPRPGEAASPLSAELGLVRLDGAWRIATESW